MASASRSDRTVGGSDSTESWERDEEGHWFRLRLGRSCFADEAFELYSELEGVYAWSEQSRPGQYFDEFLIRSESYGAALAIRPTLRIWRSLRVETSMGIQYLRTESSQDVVEEGSRSLEVFEVSTVQFFEFRGEWDLAFTYAF